MCDFRLFRQFKTLAEMNMRSKLAREFLLFNKNSRKNDTQKNRPDELVQTYKSASTLLELNVFYTKICGYFQIKVEDFPKKSLKGKFRSGKVPQQQLRLDFIFNTVFERLQMKVYEFAIKKPDGLDQAFISI